MIRSPSSASAISSARSRSGGMINALHRILRDGVRQRRPPGQLGQFAHELAGAVRDDQRAMTGLIALANVDVAGEDDDEAGPDFCQP